MGDWDLMHTDMHTGIGSLHLGNYLGAIRQWVEYQEVYDNYFCVVDLHAITVPHDPKRLKLETLQVSLQLLLF
jgi:tryptophanyl-tRNA synthetase